MSLLATHFVPPEETPGDLESFERYWRMRLPVFTSEAWAYGMSVLGFCPFRHCRGADFQTGPSALILASSFGR